MIPCAHPVGFVDLDGVWLDDRARCNWALCGLDLAISAGQLVAILGAPGDGGPAAVLDLLARRRLPVEGSVRLDGVDTRDIDARDHRRAVVETGIEDIGERRLRLGRRTTVAIRPTPRTLVSADQVVVLAGGAEVARGTHEQLLAGSKRYEQLLAS